MIDDATLRKLDGLSLRLLKAARGNAGGARRSRLLGSSAEFSDFREYAPGDDIRRIDWNAYARFDRLFLKLFTEEREACVSLWLDASASMRAKWKPCVEAAQMLCYLALAGGDRVRIYALRGDRVEKSEAYLGRAMFYHAARYLDALEPEGETRLSAALRRVGTLPAGLSVVLSDLFSADGYEDGLGALLYQKQDVALIHALSEEELSPDMEGAVRLMDAEGGAPVELLATGETLRLYRRELDAFTNEARSFCHRRAVRFVPLVAREGWSAELLRTLMAAQAVT